MPQLKINSGYSKSSITPAFFVITFSLLFLSGCASMMQIPEGPAEATLAVEKGRILVSHGDVYETGQDGMILEPDVRVIVLEGAKAKVNYTVIQEGDETAFNCAVELEENSQLIVNGAKDCAGGEIVANNINVTASEQAAAEFPADEELTETNSVVAANEEADNAGNAITESELAKVVANKPESVAQSQSQSAVATASAKAPAAVGGTQPDQQLQPVAAVKDIQLPATGKITPPADVANVASITPADKAQPPVETEDLSALADAAIPKSSVPAEQVALVNQPEKPTAAMVTQETAPLVRKTIVNTKTIELPDIDMQSIAAVTKAADIPVVLQRLPQRIPGIKYIDAVIMPDNS
jgi:hypothetical protein